MLLLAGSFINRLLVVAYVVFIQHARSRKPSHLEESPAHPAAAQPPVIALACKLRLQCAGNRRSEMAAHRVVEGRAPWNAGGPHAAWGKGRGGGRGGAVLIASDVQRPRMPNGCSPRLFPLFWTVDGPPSPPMHRRYGQCRLGRRAAA